MKCLKIWIFLGLAFTIGCAAGYRTLTLDEQREWCNEVDFIEVEWRDDACYFVPYWIRR